MSIHPVPASSLVPYSASAVSQMTSDVQQECRNRILSIYHRSIEANAISSAMQSRNLFTSALSITKKMSGESEELVCHLPSHSLLPSTYEGMKLSELLQAHPKFELFAFDLALHYEKAGFKSFADEIRREVLNFKRTSPKSPNENDSHFLFPPLPGKFSVGTKRFYFEDPSRNETELGSQSDLTRRLEIDVYYPAVQTKEPEYQAFPLNTEWITDPSKKECLENLWVRSQPGLPPMREEKFPMIIFSHGYGCNSNFYQQIVEPLASHGYCVVTVNHPSTNVFTFSLGHYQLPMRRVSDDPSASEAVLINTRDLEFVIDQINVHPDFRSFFGESLDFGAIGVFGHSLGGTTSLEICRSLPEVVKAGLNLDGYFSYSTHPNSKVNQPFHTISATALEPDIKEEDRRQREEDFKLNQEAYERLRQISPNASRTVFSDALHMDFCLIPMLPTFEGKPNPHYADIVRRTNEEVLKFFNQHLKGH
jgi:pimeloyl-ACP methyl ester carboxylesterase